jgi:hypothetical protein
MPAANPRKDRVPQDITDISSADQLLRYATAGRLERLIQRGYTQGKIARGAGFGKNDRNAGPALSRALRRGPTAAELQELDEIIGTLDPHPDGARRLSSLALRLSEDRRDKVDSSSLAARVPPSWTAKVLAGPPPDETGVLLQASAVLSEFMAADKLGSADVIARIRDRYQRELELLVRRLIIIAVSPPMESNYDAQVLLGMLASYTLEPLIGRLDYQLRHSPMSFRVWPAITKLVKLSSEDGQRAERLKRWVQQLVRDSGTLRQHSLYAGRGLDLELAISVPASWSPDQDDWVGEALLARALDGNATIRERGTASMGLWQRALREGRASLAKTKDDLRVLIKEFRDPESRPDAAAGMRWLAATLEYVIDNELAVCNDWPDTDEPWFRNVQVAAAELDGSGIPEHLRTGTKNLFRHMVLQNAGAHRREALETVVTSGWSEPVARALGSLLRTERDEAWLRIRAEFALSFLQQRDPTVEADLAGACQHAYQNLKLDRIPEDQEPPRSHVTELHAALFAVGDCFGIQGYEERARGIRETLRPILVSLASGEGTRAAILHRPARAAAYLLMVTAQSEHGGKPDLSRELLTRMTIYPDAVTRALSAWALSFLFAPDGQVRPLLAAVEHNRGENLCRACSDGAGRGGSASPGWMCPRFPLTGATGAPRR